PAATLEPRRERQAHETARKKTPAELRKEILGLTREYYQAKFGKKDFVPGKDLVHYSGRVFDADEMTNLVDSGLDFFLTASRFTETFETELAEFLGVNRALLVNSGSSANLLALSALTSPKLGSRRLKPGDEVITVAAAFPTTLTPILQNQLVPVFVDITLPTYDIDVSQLENALSERTRAV